MEAVPWTSMVSSAADPDPRFLCLSGPRSHKMKGSDRIQIFFRVAGSTDPNRDVERERIWIRFSAGLDPI